MIKQGLQELTSNGESTGYPFRQGENRLGSKALSWQLPNAWLQAFKKLVMAELLLINESNSNSLDATGNGSWQFGRRAYRLVSIIYRGGS
jgi:hypothetical protein